MSFEVDQRNTIIDIIKGLAILFVLWGHCIQFSSAGEYDFFADPIFKFIYSFHMPLFAMISGYLFYDSLGKMTLREVIKKKIMTLLWPIFFWSIIRYCVEGILQATKGKFAFSINEWMSFFAGNFLWYLWRILVMSIGVAIVMKIFPEKLRFLGGIVFFFVVGVFPNPDKNMFLYPYFITGYYAKKFELQKFFHKKWICITAVLFAILLPFFKKKVTFILAGCGY